MIGIVPNIYRRVLLATFVLVVLLAGAMTARHGITRTAQDRFQKEDREKERAGQREKFLFVWAGDQARTNPDFLAVVNFDEDSADYGKVVTTVPLPGPGATGNGVPERVVRSRPARGASPAYTRCGGAGI